MDKELTSKEIPPVNTETKTEKASIFKSKFFIILLAVILLVALAAGAFFFGKYYSKNNVSPTAQNTKSQTPAPSQTTDVAGWKTYTNSKYGYSIDYLNSWRVREFDQTKTGAAFSPLNKSNDYVNETISIDAGLKSTDSLDLPFESYAKIAATKEIQGYKSLVSIKKITTTEGLIGYETTWMVQSIGPGGSAESSPITYFELPNNKNYVVRFSLSQPEDLAVYEKMLTTFKLIGQQKTQETFLKIPEYGVQITLSDEIKDAYSVKKNGYIYLKVSSLDSEPQCKSDDTSIAALGRVGKDEINPMSGGKYSDSFNGKVIGNYFYYIDLAQYSCAEKPENKVLLDKIRKAFSNASSTIQSL